MTNLEPGQIVLFFQQARLRLGLILTASDRLCQVEDIDGAVHKLTPDRMVLVSKHSYTPPDSATLQTFMQGLAVAAADISEPQILETLSRLASPFSFEEACAALDFTDDKRRFALFAFMKDRADLWSSKHGFFDLRSPEERQHYLQKQAEANKRSEYLQKVAAFLKTTSEQAAEPLPQDLRAILLQELRTLLIDKEPTDLAKVLHSCAPDKECADHILQLRLLLGDISADTDPEAARSGIPIRFERDLWGQALPAPLTEAIALDAFCIDAADSPDHDDAISLQALDDGWRLGIHISDVASRIDPASELWAQARERVSSLYLAGETVALLPERFSSDEFSLLAGEPRPVLSLYVILDRGLAVVAHEFRREMLCVAHNLSYDEADSRLDTEPFSSLRGICRKLQIGRSSGASDLRPRYSWHLKVSAGDVQMQRIDNLSPARFIVEELMILYNRLLAEAALQADLPLIFRNIAQWTAVEDDPDSPVLGIQAFLSTRAQFHPGIGSQAYLHATSPIRRFTDIVNQVQFTSLLENQPLPFTREQLEDLIPPIDKRLLQLRLVAQRSERYWLLRFLLQKHLHEPLDAILTKKTRQGYLAELTRWDKRVVVRCDDRPPLQIPVKLVIGSVDLEELLVTGDVVL